MKIVCDACSAKYSIADEKVRGKVFKIRCKKCSNIIVVRGSVSDAAEQAAPQHDQKETKVFAYSGTQRADSAAEVSESAVWHLVIDQEQVGPMTIEEVRDRFHRGEVDGEGFVWREGFGDWERLADVEELAGIVGTPARPDDGGLGVLFGAGGGEPYDDARAAQSDPADLFAARGAGDDAGASTSDLFSGTGLGGDVGAADSDGLFAGDGGGAGMAAASGGKPVVSSLTAQRNENSVLFSLNNLAALASDSPRSAPLSAPAASSSSASMSSSSSASMSAAPQSEGSGLIDIRSMAQVYLGDSKPQAARPVGTPDDLPVFSQTSFESASPVLLPTVQPAVNNRLLIALVGLIGVLVIAAVVLVVIVLKGGGNERAQVAAADTPDPAASKSPAAAAAPATADPAAPPSTPPPAGGTTGSTDPSTAAAMPPSAPASDPAEAGSSKDDEDDDGDAKSASSDRDRRDRKSRDKDRDKDRRDRDRRDRRDRKSDERDKDEKVATAPSAPDPTATSGCDEVTCLVEPDKPCCKKYGRRPSSSGSSSRSSDPSLPEQPSRGDVASGIGAVKGSVSSCGSRAPGGGKVTVKIKISPSGSVSSASASGGSSSLNGCVESAVRRARFPKSQFGVSVNYPFIF